ncbi:hypothetical protein ACFL59_15565 [Planctomycetota bacterium]
MRQAVWLGVILAAAILMVAEHVYAGVRGRSFVRRLLSSDDVLCLGGKEDSVLKIAERFRPVIAHCDDEPYPPRRLLLLPRVHGDRLLLDYRVVRDNERHPVRVIHYLYCGFRFFYFGSARDIEYIQVEVDLTSGGVAGVAFERARLGKITVQHVASRLELGGDEGEPCRLHSGSRPPAAFTPLRREECSSSGLPFVFILASWNGLFRVAETESDIAELLTADGLPVRICDGLTAYRYRLWRRSRATSGPQQGPRT